ncbi:MAG: RdgB/HAM1 family non-canonical purine NTP pyrophosphatase [Bacteroidia bacterium]|nr:RdgB/HAM1 family non-canonical purine NTP pyrophosphatase [Bacteroidia bacterium]
MNKLIFASHNSHKAKEINAIFQGLLTVVSLEEIGFFEEIIESGFTLSENAEIKAKAVYAATQFDCFADDTGLLVEALNGAPGVHTARYAGPEKNAAQNNAKLIHALQTADNRKARFETVIHLIWKGESHQFIGVLEGTIGFEPVGTEGFGYDPIFIPLGSDRTLAQMSLPEKNAISHRARAFQQMLDFFKK